MSKLVCTPDPCPVILDSSCVFYEGPNLVCVGINTNTTIEQALQKINQMLCDGISGDKNFVFNQAVPSTTWYIVHNLNKFPSVTVVNINNVTMYGDVKYINENELQIDFSAGFSGKAYIN
jgi:hypothetical protein